MREEFGLPALRACPGRAAPRSRGWRPARPTTGCLRSWRRHVGPDEVPAPTGTARHGRLVALYAELLGSSGRVSRPTRSCRSAATRSPTSRCHSGWSGRSAACRPDGTSRPSRNSSRNRSGAGAAPCSSPTCCCERLPSSCIVGTHANLFTLLGGRPPAARDRGLQLRPVPGDRRLRRGATARHAPQRGADRRTVGAGHRDRQPVRRWPRLAADPPGQRAHLADLDRARLALLVHRGPGPHPAADGAPARRPGCRPTRAALAVLVPVCARGRRPAHPVRRGRAGRRPTRSIAPTSSSGSSPLGWAAAKATSQRHRAAAHPAGRGVGPGVLPGLRPRNAYVVVGC